MYALKGITALYVRPGITLRPIIGGGGQEFGLKAGTENVAFAVGLGEAAHLVGEAISAGEQRRLTELRDRLASRLQNALPGLVHINGHPTDRLPNTLNIRINGVPALRLLATVLTVAASAGSACHAGNDKPSTVLTALGLTSTEALCAI